MFKRNLFLNIVNAGIVEAIVVVWGFTICFGYGPPWEWSTYPPPSKLASVGWTLLFFFGGPVFLVVYGFTIRLILKSHRRYEEEERARELLEERTED